MDRLTRTVMPAPPLNARRVSADQPTPVEEQFMSLTRLSSDWYWETDENGRITLVSDGLRRVFDIGPETVLGKTRLEMAARQDDPGLQEYGRKTARREPFQDIEYLGIVPGKGDASHLLISGDPVFERGAFRGYRGVGRDITGERRSAQRIVDLAAENCALPSAAGAGSAAGLHPGF